MLLIMCRECHHENLLKLHGVSTQDGPTFIVTELLTKGWLVSVDALRLLWCIVTCQYLYRVPVQLPTAALKTIEQGDSSWHGNPDLLSYEIPWRQKDYSQGCGTFNYSDTRVSVGVFRHSVHRCFWAPVWQSWWGCPDPPPRLSGYPCTYSMRYICDLIHKLTCIFSSKAARNCLVGERNVVKLADLSLALFTSKRPPVTNVAPVRWAAPEVLQGGPTQFSIKSDVWSFGK